MYIHKNHLIKSPGLYTIYVKNWRNKKKLFSLSVLQMERELSNRLLFFRLGLCLFEPGKKKLYNLPGQDCYLCFETIWPFEPVLAQKEFVN